jgi:hypothetical protein
MKAVHPILHRVWVMEFYKTNASFFLLVLGFAAGFMRSPDHIALGLVFVSSPLLFLVPFVVWLLYTVKVIRFNVVVLKRKETEFLYQFNLQDLAPQLIILFVATFKQLLPVYAYAIFLAGLALKQDVIMSFFLIVASVTGLQMMSIVLLKHSLNYPNQEKQADFLKRTFDNLMAKPYPMIAIEWIVRRKTVAFAGFKLFACALLYGTTQLYDVSYDTRLLCMALTVATGAQVSILYELHRFENFHFVLLRQLPIKRFQRIMFTAIVLLALSLPECGIIISSFPSHLTSSDCFAVLVFGWSLMALQYGFFYCRDRDEAEITAFIFGGVMIYFVLILFRVPIALLAGVNFLFTFWMIRKYYYGFEARVKT